MKKKLLAIMVFVGLAMTGLFLGSINSFAAQEITTSDKVSARAGTIDLQGTFFEREESHSLDAYITVEEDDRSDLGYYGNSQTMSKGYYVIDRGLFGLPDSGIITPMERGNTQIYIDSEITNYHTDYDYPEQLRIYATGDWYFSVECDDPRWPGESNFHLFIETDKRAPIISGTTNVSVNVDNQPSQAEIVSHVTAVDETDGVLPVRVKSSNYVQGEMKVGVFTIVVTATDNAGNTSEAEIRVTKWDGTKPTLALITQKSYVLNYNHTETLSSILANVRATDNVDSDLSINVVKDTFTGNERKLGSYEIVLNTKDKSKNVSENLVIPVKVENQGYTTITLPKEIRVGTGRPLTLAELKKQISVIDGYDGVIEDYIIEGFDEYLANANTVGEAPFTVKYTNSGNHLSTATSKIIKEDTQDPNFYFDKDYFVFLSAGQEFTLDMLKEHVVNVLGIASEEIVAINGEFDIATAGEYDLEVCLLDTSTRAFTLVVKDTEATLSGSAGFSWSNFFSVANYKENFFNFSKWKEWNICIWLTYFGAGALLGYGIYLYLSRKKKKR